MHGRLNVKQGRLHITPIFVQIKLLKSVLSRLALKSFIYDGLVLSQGCKYSSVCDMRPAIIYSVKIIGQPRPRA